MIKQTSLLRASMIAALLAGASAPVFAAPVKNIALVHGAWTGNLVLLAAHLVVGGDAQVAKLLAVPVYVVTASLTTVLTRRLQANGFDALRALLLLHFALLVAFLAVCAAADSPIDPNEATAIVAGMVGVSAMAVQNTLVQSSLEGMPPSGMMTGNVTRLAIDLSDVLLGSNPARVAEARRRAARTLPLIAGFAGGCGLGAALESATGMWALAMPAALAALALALAHLAHPRAPEPAPWRCGDERGTAATCRRADRGFENRTTRSIGESHLRHLKRAAGSAPERCQRDIRHSPWTEQLTDSEIEASTGTVATSDRVASMSTVAVIVVSSRLRFGGRQRWTVQRRCARESSSATQADWPFGGRLVDAPACPTSPACPLVSNARIADGPTC